MRSTFHPYSHKIHGYHTNTLTHALYKCPCVRMQRERKREREREREREQHAHTAAYMASYVSARTHARARTHTHTHQLADSIARVLVAFLAGLLHPAQCLLKCPGGQQLHSGPGREIQKYFPAEAEILCTCMTFSICFVCLFMHCRHPPTAGMHESTQRHSPRDTTPTNQHTCNASTPRHTRSQTLPSDAESTMIFPASLPWFMRWISFNAVSRSCTGTWFSPSRMSLVDLLLSQHCVHGVYGDKYAVRL
jgi:hypothetical protein